MWQISCHVIILSNCLQDLNSRLLSEENGFDQVKDAVERLSHLGNDAGNAAVQKRRDSVETHFRDVQTGVRNDLEEASYQFDTWKKYEDSLEQTEDNLHRLSEVSLPPFSISDPKEDLITALEELEVGARG